MSVERLVLYVLALLVGVAWGGLAFAVGFAVAFVLLAALAHVGDGR